MDRYNISKHVPPTKRKLQDNFKLITALVNFCYYLLLVPIRFTLGKDNKFRITSHKLQKFACGALNFLSIIQGILLTRGAYTNTIVEKPDVMFSLWTRIHLILVPSLWTFFFFRKQSKILSLINCLKNTLPNKKMKLSSFLLPIFAYISHSAYVIVVIIFGGRNHPGKGFDGACAQVMYELFLTKDHLPQSEITYSTFIISLCYFGMRIYSMVIVGMACALAFIVALVFYQSVGTLLELCDLLENGELISREQEVILEYLKLRMLVHNLNEVVGPFLLLLCSSSVPVFVGYLIPAWDTARWDFRLLVMVKTACFLGPFFLAAEAYDKSKRLKSRLLELNHRDNDATTSGKIFRDKIGLIGGNFFTVSYGFLGSVASVYLSYAIMLLQMRP